MSNLLALRYGAEIPLYLPRFKREVEQLAVAGLRATVSPADTGSGVFGAAIYDLSAAHEKPNPQHRAESRRLGGLSMKYMNFLDDAIDDPTLGLMPAQKRDLIRRLIGEIWSQTESSGEPFPATGYFEMATRLGEALHAEVCDRDTHGSYTATLSEFAEAEAVHGQDASPDGLLASVIELGKPCGTIMSAGVEIVTGKKDAAVTKAAESLGIYGMLLDHAYEVNADLRDNSPTIVTAMLKRDGDNRRTRKEARELCLDHANDVRQAGREQLSPEQRQIYSAMAKLFEARYKVVVRLKDSLVH